MSTQKHALFENEHYLRSIFLTARKFNTWVTSLEWHIGFLLLFLRSRVTCKPHALDN